jgi:phospholipid/cholesterol/gamma-HCH transport system ATP-binding protein
MDTVVKINKLHFRRGNRAVFKGVDLVAKRGTVTAILGPSGAGKTTLLRLVGGQLSPDLGTVDVLGKRVHTLGRSALFDLRKHMGFLFQSGALFTHLTVFENVAFAIREHTQMPESLIRQLVLMKLQAVGLRGAHDLMPNELSGGMARRASLARAIALDPQLMMYDEPLSGQDPISMGVLVKLIRSLNDALGMTSIMVSHDVTETLSIADYVYVVADGEVIGHGTPKEIERAKSPQLKQFLQGLPDGPVPFHYPTDCDLKEDLLGENA